MGYSSNLLAHNLQLKHRRGRKVSQGVIGQEAARLHGRQPACCARCGRWGPLLARARCRRRGVKRAMLLCTAVMQLAPAGDR